MWRAARALNVQPASGQSGLAAGLRGSKGAAVPGKEDLSLPARSSKTPKLNRKAEFSPLEFRPLTPRLMDDLGAVLRGSWGSGCWCMYPRLTRALEAELPEAETESERRRAAMTELARRRRAPGLLAFEGEEAVGWIAIAPRTELARIEASRATPGVDEEEIWVIPCVTVRKTERGSGIAVALIRAAVDYAAEHGAPAVEAYPRAGEARVGDDNAYFGTEPLFRRAGFTMIRGPLENVPSNWTPRVVMRMTVADRNRAGS